MEYYMDNVLGKELKRLRKENNLSQEEVAKHLHITRQTYSHYETGRIQPPVKKLDILKTLYKVPLSDLLKYLDIDSEKESILSGQERELLHHYRKLDRKNKELILQMAKQGGGVEH